MRFHLTSPSTIVLVLLVFCLAANLNATAELRQIDIPQVEIPGGAFHFGCSSGDRLCDADEGVQGGIAVQIPGFSIDVHETSVNEYQRCVAAGQCSKPFDYLRVHYCNFDAPGRGDYPVNCVNWQQAREYCDWRDSRLAYAVEWEYAARAGTQTPYVWGFEKADCQRAVMDPGLPGQRDTETDGCWRDLSWPRGSFPANPWGLFDTIGGTSEWVMDWYHPGAFQEYYSKGHLTGPQMGNHKVIKGGSWDEKHKSQRVSNLYHKPVTGNPDLYGSNGIRCVTPQARSLGEATLLHAKDE